jgi:hypothetical protein
MSTALVRDGAFVSSVVTPDAKSRRPEVARIFNRRAVACSRCLLTIAAFELLCGIEQLLKLPSPRARQIVRHWRNPDVGRPAGAKTEFERRIRKRQYVRAATSNPRR